jgi:taurine dioxygenase
MSSMTIQPITKAIGANIEGIDLNRDLTPAVSDALYDALMKHHALVFRKQDLTPEAHVALAECFGPVVPFHPFYPSIEGHPPVAVIHDHRDSPPENHRWHSDLSATKQPPFGSVLRSKLIPPVGGDTLWCSMHAVYDSLSPSMKRYLEGMMSVHDLRVSYAPASGNKQSELRAQRLNETRPEEMSVRHPVAMPHPSNGRPLIYVNCDYTTRIEGLPESESRGILQTLYELSNNPHFSFRLRWEPDTVVVWDNYATQHLAVADHYPQQRIMNRVTIADDRRAAAKRAVAQVA